jgi:hypothetical protein
MMRQLDSTRKLRFLSTGSTTVRCSLSTSEDVHKRSRIERRKSKDQPSRNRLLKLLYKTLYKTCSGTPQKPLKQP